MTELNKSKMLNNNTKNNDLKRATRRGTGITKNPAVLLLVAVLAGLCIVGPGETTETLWPDYCLLSGLGS